MLYSILGFEELNFLSPLSQADYKEVRKIVIGCILATDMGKHAELIARIKEIDGKFSMEDPSHKTLVMND